MVSLDLRWLPLRCWQWLALALRLEALALSVESFFFLLCLPVVDMVVLLFATAGHRLPGDLILTLLSGLIATASRRNLTNNFIACREEPCS
jgi:hypothetical protein